MASDCWDVIVSPWHLDEHLPACPVPAGAVAAVVPPLPAGSRPDRMKRLAGRESGGDLARRAR